MHDDLARELAFYESSLAAVKEGRRRLKAQGVSWKRPEDFFCEMIKSDSHMNRVKERLIFEQKKMEAFEQRKERQSQKKFSKARSRSRTSTRARGGGGRGMWGWLAFNRRQREEEGCNLCCLPSSHDRPRPVSCSGSERRRRRRRWLR